MTNFESQLREAMRQDPEMPNRQVWLRAKESWLEKGKRGRRLRRLRWAMAASLLLLLGASLYFINTKKDTEQDVLVKYGLEHRNYPAQVRQHLDAMQGVRLPRQQAEHLQVLRDQLYFLDQQYQNYLDYIQQNGYQEFIGKQIQNYYEVKIELLETIRKEIEKFKILPNEQIELMEAVDWNI